MHDAGQLEVRLHHRVGLVKHGPAASTDRPIDRQGIVHAVGSRCSLRQHVPHKLEVRILLALLPEERPRDNLADAMLSPLTSAVFGERLA
jgi:hypothetical protein